MCYNENGSDNMKKKINIKDILIIIIGAMIVAFALCNIHSKMNISEGGQLGVELLLLKWFNISPSISSFIIDFSLYLLGFLILGKKFFINAIIGTLSYSIFYHIFEIYPININLPNNLLLISILGGIIVGIGCGLIVRKNGACGGDDSLAQIIRKLTKLPLAICYFIMDVVIILISLSYIPFNIIIYSFITSFTSSIIIGTIAEYKNK